MKGKEGGPLATRGRSNTVSVFPGYRIFYTFAQLIISQGVPASLSMISLQVISMNKVQTQMMKLDLFLLSIVLRYIKQW